MDEDCPHGLAPAWCSLCLGKVELLASTYRKPGRKMPRWLLVKLGLIDDKPQRGPLLAARVPAAHRPDPRVYRRY